MPKYGFAFVNGGWERSQVIHHEFANVLTRVAQYICDIG